VKSSNLRKKRVKIMLDVITANEIVNALQCKGHNIEWAKDHYLKTFITMETFVNVSIRNDELKKR
jgi:hypothetical protein